MSFWYRAVIVNQLEKSEQKYVATIQQLYIHWTGIKTVFIVACREMALRNMKQLVHLIERTSNNSFGPLTSCRE